MPACFLLFTLIVVSTASISGLELWEWWSGARQQVSSLNSAAVVKQSAALPSQTDLKAELDWLLQAVAGVDHLALRTESFKEKAQIELSLGLSELAQLWHRRVYERVPVQYLIGVVPWRHFSLTVSPAVLIPRPETEYLIDLAVAAVQRHPDQQLSLEQGNWADLGTGSGAIALGLATVFPAAFIHAVDCSSAALTVAQSNAETAGLVHAPAEPLHERIQFYLGSWLEPLDLLKGNLSGLVANPPYIPTQIVSELQPEVAWHEPHLALDGGADGLDCIRQIISAAPDYLQTGGILLLEMMAGQASTVMELLRLQGSYCQIEIHPDLAGIARFALAYRV